MADAKPKKNRIANKIFAAKFIPVCPVHGKPMVSYSRGAKTVYFRCERGRNPCPHRGKAPRVEFVPFTHGGTD